MIEKIQKILLITLFRQTSSYLFFAIIIVGAPILLIDVYNSHKMSIKLFLFAIVVLVDPGSRGSPFDDKTSKFSHRYEFDMMASSTRDDVSLQLFPQYNLILINRSSQLYIKEPLLLPPYIPLYLRDFKEIVYNVYCNNKVVDWSFTTVKDFHLLHAMEQSIVGNITVVVTAIKYVQNSLALQIFSAINVETKERWVELK